MLYLLEILIALAPSYVVRFGIGGLRLDLLEVLQFLFWIICLILLWQKNLLASFKSYLLNIPRKIYLFGFLFLVAAAVSVFISPTHSRAGGEFLAFFLEPMITFLFAGYILKNEQSKNHFLKFILWYIAALSVYAAFQYFTRIGLPPAWWGNSNEPKRSLSIFEYPNAFALFITPLLAYSLPLVFGEKSQATAFRGWLYKILFFIGVIGLGFSLSRGGWLGLFVAALLFMFIGASRQSKKIFAGAAIVAVVVVLAVPVLRYRVELPFKGDKSTVSRYSLWYTGEKMITSSPILGKGLNGFASDFTTFNTDPNLAPLNYPHNIFLNFWVETGLLGVLSFIGLSLSAIWIGLKKYRAGDAYGLAIILFLVAIYVHGYADAPYFKNDLALVFWTILATII
jgi:O-antigen ligase